MSDKQTDVPRVTDVLAGSPNNWGRWGDDDEVGSLNYLGTKEVVNAARLVKQGKVFTLQVQMGHPHGDPMSPARQPGIRLMYRDQGSWAGDKVAEIPGGGRYADDYITTFLQGSTQYDALGHVWYDDVLYNGYDASTTIGGLSRASILPIAERGIVGRGVLIDMPRYRDKPFLERDEGFTHEDVMAAAASQEVELQKRDVLLIRTGWVEYFYTVENSVFYETFREPGLRYSPELVSWFQAMEIPNLVTDTIGNEISVDPVTKAELLLHCALMRNLGITFTEICDLGKLARDCSEDGQWEFLYVAAPLKVVHGTGSPVNPVVIK
jgi:kynurenine formamidase